MIAGSLRRMMHNRNITLGQMQRSGHRLFHVVCGDRKCGHSVVIDTDCWPQSLRLSDVKRLFVCQVCGHHGAGVQADLAGLSREPRVGENADRRP